MGSVRSASVADGNNARVTALFLKAAKYTSYTALTSGVRAGSTTKPMTERFQGSQMSITEGTGDVLDQIVF